jgi:hypothetical protein
MTCWVDTFRHHRKPLKSLQLDYMLLRNKRLNRFAILIDPLRADEVRLTKDFIDPIRDPSCAVRPTPAVAPLVPGLRRYLKHR